MRSDDLLTPAELAQRLGVSRSWLYDAARTGRIPSVRLGGADGPLRFIEDEVDAWLAASRPARTVTDGRAGDHVPAG